MLNRSKQGQIDRVGRSQMLSEEWSSPRAHALVAAWTSVVIGCVITALSFYTAQQLKSMSLYALSIMSAIDTASSVLVIVFWRECQSEESATLSQHKKEQKYTLSVGVMMIIMGVMLLGDSLKTLVLKDQSSFTSALGSLGVAISTLGVGSGLLLGWYKYFIARALNSALVYADALSSLCAGLASLVALVVAEDRAMAWWADAMAGSLVACYTLYQGYLTVIKSIAELKHIQTEERTVRGKYDQNLGPNGSYQTATLEATPIASSASHQSHAQLKATALLIPPTDFSQNASWFMFFASALVPRGRQQTRYFNNQEYVPVDQQLDLTADEEITFSL